jgi:hypothetical protein
MPGCGRADARARFVGYDLATMNPAFEAYIERMLAFVGNDDPMNILAEAPAHLSALVSSVGAAARARRPDARTWSINQVAAHMADTELVSGYRLRMILTVDGVPLQAFDQDHWAETFDYDACDALESARLYAAYRHGTLRALRLVDPVRFDNHGRHPERGIETVHHLLRLYAGHDRNHLAQIQRIVENSS